MALSGWRDLSRYIPLRLAACVTRNGNGIPVLLDKNEPTTQQKNVYVRATMPHICISRCYRSTHTNVNELRTPLRNACRVNLSIELFIILIFCRCSVARMPPHTTCVCVCVRKRANVEGAIHFYDSVCVRVALVWVSNVSSSSSSQRPAHRRLIQIGILLIC